MNDWFETLDGFWQKAWEQLACGVQDKHHPARHPSFATVSPDGWPEARTVVLRRADLNTRSLEVHTDLHSDKLASLRALPRAAFHIWNEDQKLQVRLRTEVTVLSGDEVAALWAKVPNPSRQAYGVTPPPGTPIATALAYVKAQDPATFAVLRCAVVYIDLVHLGADHRRARFTKLRDWQGQWLAP